jgi:elongator complex protein 2
MGFCFLALTGLQKMAIIMLVHLAFAHLTSTNVCLQTATGGHVAPVVDACWSHDGQFLLTASTDQTARIFSKFVKRDSGSTLDDVWCELARPQVHGHDFSCLTLVPSHGTRSKEEVSYVYASGSEEKVIRIFESPQTFLDTLQIAKGKDTAIPRMRKAFLGATLPALGLSNKAIVQEEEQEASLDESNDQGYSEGADFAPTSAPSVVFAPPLEEHLSQNTLWPETHKLYGHGNDLYCICADISGKFIASACRSQSQATAGIIVWDTETWSQCCTLECHTLTVTQLVFSPCGSYLASVGRDRKISLHQKIPDENNFLTRSMIKGHSRIIWSADWSPDSNYLATGSRDSKIRIWRLDDGLLQENHALEVSCESSVQAVSFCRKGNAILLAAGFEDGAIRIFEFVIQGGIRLVEKYKCSPWDVHAASVRRVCWKPNHGPMTEPCVLASVGDDHSVKIWTI